MIWAPVILLPDLWKRMKKWRGFFARI